MAIPSEPEEMIQILVDELQAFIDGKGKKTTARKAVNLAWDYAGVIPKQPAIQEGE